MLIKSIRVKNFRSLFEETLYCDSLTALVGPNGAGKSSFLAALELFYSPSPSVVASDFYNNNTGDDIEIALTFADLTSVERKRFKSRMQSDELSVMRVFTLGGGKNSGKLYGFRLGNPAFDATRSLSGRDLTNSYRELREESKFDLPTVRSQAEALAELEKWETAHPESLILGRDDGQFFGFTNVAMGYLGDLTRFLFIPAVRDAGDDASEGRNSAITVLMDLVVRATLSKRQDIADLKRELQERYAVMTDPDSLPELGTLADRITETLQQYYSETSVKINWLPSAEIDLPAPKADLRLVEDKFSIPVTKMGHGLQRAFILSLLQHLVMANAPKEESNSPEPNADEDKPQLNLILGIEEPELYQHPSRQRHFAQVLLNLARGKILGVAARTQIIYATHSPLMVDIERFNQVRRVTRVPGLEGEPKITATIGATWTQIAEKIWIADGSTGPKYSEETLKPRLMTLMTPWMNEGFFADSIVLVEGEDDRAVILGCASLRGYSLEQMGCSVIPCDGKMNMDRPATIFSSLGIPTYLIWDGDNHEYKADQMPARAECIKANRRLLFICGKDGVDWPSCVSENYACFDIDLEKTMREEIGRGLFDALLKEEKARCGIAKDKHALKNPTVIGAIVAKAAAQEKRSPTIESIVDAIIERAKAAAVLSVMPRIA